MGRYYNGDIEGKFMFAVQSSTAADRFGAEGHVPELVEYYFDEEEHAEGIESELATIKESYDKVDSFFNSLGKATYKNEDAEEAGITAKDMSDYADYNLGKKILDCLRETGYCSFTAEL